MAGYGLGLAAGGGVDQLNELVKQRYLQAQLEEEKRQAIQNEAVKQQQLELQRQQNEIEGQYKRDLMEQQKNTQARLDAREAADRFTKGTVLTPEDTATLKAGNLGSLITHQDAALPSTSYMGVLNLGATAPTAGATKVEKQEGHDARDVFGGTAKEQMFDDKLAAQAANFNSQLAAKQSQFDEVQQRLNERNDWQKAVAFMNAGANASRASNAVTPGQRRANVLADQFAKHPIVSRMNTLAEGVNFGNSIDSKTSNPSDDQAIIYAFAKVMDPESVVREGEYATVQKYAQSWAQKFGFDVARIFSNTKFLTPEAINNMKATMNAKAATQRQSYDNLHKQYATQINRVTGGDDGDSYLVDYSMAFPPAAPQASGGGGAAPTASASPKRRRYNPQSGKLE